MKPTVGTLESRRGRGGFFVLLTGRLAKVRQTKISDVLNVYFDISCVTFSLSLNVFIQKRVRLRCSRGHSVLHC